MTCISPKLAYKKTNGQFSFTKISDTAPIAKAISVPCGQCMPCRIKHTRAWSTRMVHEAQMHETESCFVTLTYSDENIPEGKSLRPRDMQLFLKKLRNAISPAKLRVYYVGEYGEQTHRPHYHAILFGYKPDDLEKFSKNDKGDWLYTSDLLAKKWTHGFVTVGNFNSTTAEYCSKYVTKALLGKGAKDAYTDIDTESGEVIERIPPFQRSSNKPGIGASFYNKHKDQLYAHDNTVIDGKVRPLPLAYDRKYAKENPDHFAQIKKKRYASGITYSKDNPNLSTLQGLKAVKTIVEQQLNLKKRNVN